MEIEEKRSRIKELEHVILSLAPERQRALDTLRAIEADLGRALKEKYAIERTLVPVKVCKYNASGRQERKEPSANELASALNQSELEALIKALQAKLT